MHIIMFPDAKICRLMQYRKGFLLKTEVFSRNYEFYKFG